MTKQSIKERTSPVEGSRFPNSVQSQIFTNKNNLKLNEMLKEKSSSSKKHMLVKGENLAKNSMHNFEQNLFHEQKSQNFSYKHSISY